MTLRERLQVGITGLPNHTGTINIGKMQSTRVSMHGNKRQCVTHRHGDRDVSGNVIMHKLVSRNAFQVLSEMIKVTRISGQSRHQLA